MARLLYFVHQIFANLEFLGTSIVSLDPETVQLPAFSILSAMFAGACGPPEKLSVALAPRSNIVRMIVKIIDVLVAVKPANDLRREKK